MNENAVLMSIKEKFAAKILEGIKKYEYRKRPCKKDVKRMLIYATSPRKSIIGEAEILSVITKEKEALWQETKDYAGIEKEFFDDYYKDQKMATAYKLGRVIKYEQEKKLEDFNIKVAPQSFIYLRLRGDE